MIDQLRTMWPTDESVAACIKHEAETVDRAVFLAVHQPMQFRRIEVGAGQSGGDARTEQNLLDEFMTDHLPEGTMILPIIGSSGVGKSHVVRWLDAQLKRRGDRARRHVIRIPKGTSLKGVLRLLLQDLEGPAYDGLRSALLEAREQLDPELAARHLLLNLRHRLEQASAAAAERIRAGTAQPGDKRVRSYGDPRALPMLLGDSELEHGHWLTRPDGSQGVIARMAEQLTEEVTDGEDRRQHEFTVDDLDIPDQLVAALNRGSQHFYGRLRSTAGSDRLAEAVGVLNQMLDPAKQDLLQLGDGSLTELFRDVRAQLYRDGQELVLLVEDFAVLSGMQGALLQVMITEAYRDGEQVLCTMRSALAYTEGYANVPDTVLTRARSRWLIEDVPGDESEIVARIVRLVGAYLNAARLGQTSLRAAFEEAKGGSEWIPTVAGEDLEDEARTALEAFGETDVGYPLFPFNAGAIRQLCLSGSVKAGRLVFNPRNVINNVLGKVLQARDAFEKGQFPPNGLAPELRSADVSVAVGRAVPSVRLERTRRVLAAWGDQPATVAEAASLSEGVYTAFGLARPQWGVTPAESSRPLQSVQPTSSASPVREDPRHESGPRPSPEERQWQDALEAWGLGETLPQVRARQLRGWIADALLNWIPWNPLLHKHAYKSGDLVKDVFLARAQGQKVTDRDHAMVVAVAGEQLADATARAEIIQTLMAIVRLHEVHKSWSYSGAIQDAARYASFLDIHAEAAQRWLRNRFFYRTEADTVPALTDALFIGARALGVDGAESRQMVKRLDALFLEVEPSDASESGDWDRCVQRFETHRRTMRELLLDQVGARQGAGAIVFAVDAARLAYHIEHAATEATLSRTLPKLSKAVRTSELEPIVSTHNELVKTLPRALRAERETLLAWYARACEWFGADPNKSALQTTLRDTVTQAKKDLPMNFDYTALRRRLAGLNDLALKATMTDCARLGISDDIGHTISVLARRPGPVVRASVELMDDFDRFLDLHTSRVKAQILGFGEGTLAKQVDAVRHALVGIEAAFNQLEETRS